MRALFLLFLAGALISFLGSLPPGTLNVTTALVSLERGIGPGLAFAMGAIGVELVAVRVALEAGSRLSGQAVLFRWLGWLTVGLLVLVGISSLVPSGTPGPAGAGNSSVLSQIVAAPRLPAFWAGVVLSGLNPLHLVFWLLWSGVLLERKILRPDFRNYLVFLMGIAAGSLGAFFLYIYTGHRVVSAISGHRYLVHTGIGVTLLSTALLQARRLLVVEHPADAEPVEADSPVRAPKQVGHGVGFW